MRRLIGTALILGSVLVWRPDAAAGQYSWSNFSVSLGVGGVGFGVGLSYSSVGSWYDIEYHDPCWDYIYYDWYSFPCTYGYYDTGYAAYYDSGYYDAWGNWGGYYPGRRTVRLSYGYHPWRSYYPAYWGYGWGVGYWNTGIHLSFGSFYPYNWFDYGYRDHHYGPYYSPYSRGRVSPTYAAARPTVGRAGYRRGRSFYAGGPLYKESPRATSDRRTATGRAVTASSDAGSTTRTGAATAARRGSTTATSAQRRDAGARVRAPATRRSASGATTAPSTTPRARPSDALRGRGSTGSGSVRLNSPGFRAPAGSLDDRRPRLRATPSTRSTPSARTAPSTRRSNASRLSPTTRENLQRQNLQRPNLQRPNLQRSRPAPRTVPSTRSAPSTRVAPTTRAAPSRGSTRSMTPRRAPSGTRATPRAAPSRARTAPSRARTAPSRARTAPSRARSAPSRARSAPSRPAPSRSARPSRPPPTRSVAPSRSSGRSSAPRAAPSRSRSARSAPARSGSSGRARSAVRRPRGG